MGALSWCHLVLLNTMVVGLGRAQTIQLVEGSGNKIAVLGETTELRCTWTGDIDHFFQMWIMSLRHNTLRCSGQPVALTQRHTCLMWVRKRHDMASIGLMISQVTLEDAGSYSCGFTEIGSGTDDLVDDEQAVSDPGYLTVIVPTGAPAGGRAAATATLQIASEMTTPRPGATESAPPPASYPPSVSYARPQSGGTPTVTIALGSGIPLVLIVIVTLLVLLQRKMARDRKVVLPVAFQAGFPEPATDYMDLTDKGRTGEPQGSAYQDLVLLGSDQPHRLGANTRDLPSPPGPVPLADYDDTLCPDYITPISPNRDGPYVNTAGGQFRRGERK